MSELKKMGVKEFRELGYLQELNRQFLHPLGLALEIVVDDDENESFGKVWDSREDPQGIIYDIANSDSERRTKFFKNCAFVESERQKFEKSRIETLGFFVEPI